MNVVRGVPKPATPAEELFARTKRMMPYQEPDHSCLATEFVDDPAPHVPTRLTAIMVKGEHYARLSAIALLLGERRSNISHFAFTYRQAIRRVSKTVRVEMFHVQDFVKLWNNRDMQKVIRSIDVVL